MEQSHQRVIAEMHRQHQIEVEQLLEEKERVLQEETNATIAGKKTPFARSFSFFDLLLLEEHGRVPYWLLIVSKMHLIAILGYRRSSLPKPSLMVPTFLYFALLCVRVCV